MIARYHASDTPKEAHAKRRLVARSGETKQRPAPRTYKRRQREAWDAGWHFERGEGCRIEPFNCYCNATE